MNTLIAPCGCRAGSYENGWQEKRSAACVAAESAAFARSVEAGLAWARTHLARPELPREYPDNQGLTL